MLQRNIKSLQTLRLHGWWKKNSNMTSSRWKLRKKWQSQRGYPAQRKSRCLNALFWMVSYNSETGSMFLTQSYRHSYYKQVMIPVSLDIQERTRCMNCWAVTTGGLIWHFPAQNSAVLVTYVTVIMSLNYSIRVHWNHFRYLSNNGKIFL